MNPPRVVIIGNPSSGRGRAAGTLAQISSRLKADGYRVDCVETGPGRRGVTIGEHLVGAGALIVAGGDGTVHHALEPAVACGVPIYHWPSGNENLFAREFGMDRSVDRLIRSVRAHQVRMSDLGECNGKLFALMVSVGFDAEVVERVSASRHAGARRGRVSHLDYAVQGIRVWLSHQPPKLTVDIDGSRLVDERPGLVVVANSRQYGGGLDPARDARTDDAALNVVFFAAESRFGLVSWATRLAWTRGWSRLPRNERAYKPVHGAIIGAGSHVRVQVAGDSSVRTAAAQVDGEFLGRLGGPDLLALDIRVRPGALAVIGTGDPDGRASPPE